MVPRRGTRSSVVPTEWRQLVPRQFRIDPEPSQAHSTGILTQTPATDPARTAKLAQLRRSEQPLTVPTLPSRDPTIDDLRATRREQTRRRAAADTSRLLIPVQVHLDGPIGIVHMGDPHLDDDGCAFDVLERHVEVIERTEGLFAANVGDAQNNWIGRLAQLYGDQGPTAREAWLLVTWLVRSVPWLYIIKGNHDCWSGPGDPLDWLVPAGREDQGVLESWGARLELQFPCGACVRVNARHDFSGHSMWNTAHGPMRAAQQGWRDHILVCGHRHTSGYGILKDPATGLISHALRVAGYKIYDDHASGKLGLPNQNISSAVVTVINPRYADDDPRLVTTLFDVEGAAEYLTWLRSRSA